MLVAGLASVCTLVYTLLSYTLSMPYPEGRDSIYFPPIIPYKLYIQTLFTVGRWCMINEIFKSNADHTQFFLYALT